MTRQPPLDYGRCSTCGRSPLVWSDTRLICPYANCPGHNQPPTK